MVMMLIVWFPQEMFLKFSYALVLIAQDVSFEWHQSIIRLQNNIIKVSYNIFINGGP